jgi:hypothetical protein
MAVDMERRQKSERFTIVDPARPPAVPVKPKRMLLSAGGSIFGLVLGLVLAFGKELQAGTLLGEWELPKNVPVLGRLPYIKISPVTGRDSSELGSRKLAVYSSAVLLVLGAILAGFYLVSHRL